MDTVDFCALFEFMDDAIRDIRAHHNAFKASAVYFFLQGFHSTLLYDP
jgi:hypothetical protein